MIPLPEFVSILRQKLDEAIGIAEKQVLEGALVEYASPESTAMRYVGTVNHAHGLRRARELIGDIVKQLNAGDL